MRIIIKAKPSAKEERVEKITQPTFDFADDKQKEIVYKIWIKEPPEDGRANEAIIRLLLKHFGINRSQIRLVLGAKGKVKVFDIVD